MQIAQHPETNIEPQECNSTQAKNNMKNKKKSLILQQKINCFTFMFCPFVQVLLNVSVIIKN